MRRTKVIATLGPATDRPGVLAAAIAAGVDVVRLNAAHADCDALDHRLAQVRACAEQLGRHVAVLVDLPGPKIRIGDMVPHTELERGTAFLLRSDDCVGDSSGACVNYPQVVRDVHVGDTVLLDDGRIELAVTELLHGGAMTTVVAGGQLEAHKGLNVPGVTLSVGAITDRDREILAWALDRQVDWVGQSFVRGASDITELRDLMGSRPLPIVAKIEKHEAAAEIEAIVGTANAIMVARGDLAVETAPEQVPVLQRQIVRAARDAGRPVIIATEMLDSMRTRRRPTRAEASDVANAIFMRSDAVMLSGETAVGDYPLESVETMVRIIGAAEEAALPPRPVHAHQGFDDIQRAVSSAVCELATDVGADAIVPLTQSGATALAVARHRPEAPIIAVTPEATVARRLALVWGVKPLVVEFDGDVSELMDRATAAIRDGDLVPRGGLVTLTAGLFSHVPGGTDFVHVRSV
jgi:pyruvate kinase